MSDTETDPKVRNSVLAGCIVGGVGATIIVLVGWFAYHMLWAGDSQSRKAAEDLRSFTEKLEQVREDFLELERLEHQSAELNRKVEQLEQELEKKYGGHDVRDLIKQLEEAIKASELRKAPARPARVVPPKSKPTSIDTEPTWERS